MAKLNPFNKSVGKRRISVFRFSAVLLLFIGLGCNVFLGFEQSKEEDDDGSRNTSLKTKESRESVFPKGLLPKRIYTVTGLESSGTNFVSSILAHALGIGQYRQSGTGARGGNDDVWVQHMSLPTVSVPTPKALGTLKSHCASQSGISVGPIRTHASHKRNMAVRVVVDRGIRARNTPPHRFKMGCYQAFAPHRIPNSAPHAQRWQKR